MGYIVGFVRAVIALGELVTLILRYIRDTRKAQADEKKSERDKAVDDLEGAKDEAEFDDAQDRIVGNKP